MIDKLLEEVATLNVATIRDRLIALREQAQALDSQFHSTQSRLSELASNKEKKKSEPEHQRFEKDAERFLGLLLERSGNATGLEFIARVIGVSNRMAEYHCNTLVAAKMIQWMGFGVELTPKGVEYIVNVLGKG